MIRVVHSGSRIRILTFYPSRIQNPGVEKAPDPGSGSATLSNGIGILLVKICKLRRTISYKKYLNFWLIPQKNLS
jgi:hypothetical protein